MKSLLSHLWRLTSRILLLSSAFILAHAATPTIVVEPANPSTFDDPLITIQETPPGDCPLFFLELAPVAIFSPAGTTVRIFSTPVAANGINPTCTFSIRFSQLFVEGTLSTLQGTRIGPGRLPQGPIIVEYKRQGPTPPFTSTFVVAATATPVTVEAPTLGHAAMLALVVLLGLLAHRQSKSARNFMFITACGVGTLVGWADPVVGQVRDIRAPAARSEIPQVIVMLNQTRDNRTAQDISNSLKPGSPTTDFALLAALRSPLTTNPLFTRKVAPEHLAFLSRRDPNDIELRLERYLVATYESNDAAAAAAASLKFDSRFQNIDRVAAVKASVVPSAAIGLPNGGTASTPPVLQGAIQWGLFPQPIGLNFFSGWDITLGRIHVASIDLGKR